MFGQLLGNLFDKEKLVNDTIQDALKSVAEELTCQPNELFIMIKPVNIEFEFKCFIYHLPDGNAAKTTKVREISLNEILGGDAEETE